MSPNTIPQKQFSLQETDSLCHIIDGTLQSVFCHISSVVNCHPPVRLPCVVRFRTNCMRMSLKTSCDHPPILLMYSTHPTSTYPCKIPPLPCPRAHNASSAHLTPRWSGSVEWPHHACCHYTQAHVPTVLHPLNTENQSHCAIYPLVPQSRKEVIFLHTVVFHKVSEITATPIAIMSTAPVHLQNPNPPAQPPRHPRHTPQTFINCMVYTEFAYSTFTMLHMLKGTGMLWWGLEPTVG